MNPITTTEPTQTPPPGRVPKTFTLYLPPLEEEVISEPGAAIKVTLIKMPTQSFLARDEARRAAAKRAAGGR